MSCLADFAIVSAAFYLAYVTAGGGGLQAPSETATTESSSASSSAVSTSTGTGLYRNQRQTARFKASVPALERPLPIIHTDPRGNLYLAHESIKVGYRIIGGQCADEDAYATRVPGALRREPAFMIVVADENDRDAVEGKAHAENA